MFCRPGGLDPALIVPDQSIGGLPVRSNLFVYRVEALSKFGH